MESQRVHRVDRVHAIDDSTMAFERILFRLHLARRIKELDRDPTFNRGAGIRVASRVAPHAPRHEFEAALATLLGFDLTALISGFLHAFAQFTNVVNDDVPLGASDDDVVALRIEREGFTR